MEKTLDHLERQIDLLARGLDNLREIVQLLRMKREEERHPTVKVEQEEDWDSEATNPPFYLQTNSTISFEQRAVRCPACGGRPSRCHCQ